VPRTVSWRRSLSRNCSAEAFVSKCCFQPVQKQEGPPRGGPFVLSAIAAPRMVKKARGACHESQAKADAKPACRLQILQALEGQRCPYRSEGRGKIQRPCSPCRRRSRRRRQAPRSHSLTPIVLPKSSVADHREFDAAHSANLEPIGDRIFGGRLRRGRATNE